jgi:hypothetical protein
MEQANGYSGYTPIFVSASATGLCGHSQRPDQCPQCLGSPNALAGIMSEADAETERQRIFANRVDAERNIGLAKLLGLDQAREQHTQMKKEALASIDGIATLADEFAFEPDGAAADLIEIAFIVARMFDDGIEISGAIHEAILSPGRLIEWARQGESRITDVRANAAIGLLDSM